MPSLHDIGNLEHDIPSRAKRVLQVDAAGDPITPATTPTNYSLETGGNLALIKAKTDNLDLATTALRDALRGTNSKTLSDLQTRLDLLLADATFTGRLGEVQASPTSNTVLDRLKQLLTGIVLAAGTNLIGKVSASDETSTLYNGTTALTPAYAAIAAATSGNNTLRTNPNAGKKIRVLAMCVIAGVAGDIYFTSDAGGTVIFGGSTNKIKLAANGGFVLPYNPKGWFETSADQDLVMNASNTGPYSGGLTYVEV